MSSSYFFPNIKGKDKGMQSSRIMLYRPWDRFRTGSDSYWLGCCRTAGTCMHSCTAYATWCIMQAVWYMHLSDFCSCPLMPARSSYKQNYTIKFTEQSWGESQIRIWSQLPQCNSDMCQCKGRLHWHRAQAMCGTLTLVQLHRSCMSAEWWCKPLRQWKCWHTRGIAAASWLQKYFQHGNTLQNRHWDSVRWANSHLQLWGPNPATLPPTTPLLYWPICLHRLLTQWWFWCKLILRG